jgi:hypothetical protein
MKSIAALLVGVVSVALAGAPNAQIARVHTVYLLPMNNGFDQFLANRLTNLGVFQVVTDPKKADAVLTDRLGEAFESRFLELYPEAKPVAPAPPQASAETPAPAKKAAAAEAPKAAESAKSAKSGAPAPKKDEGASTAKADKPEAAPAEPLASFQVGSAPPVPVSTFHRAKGTVFLVDRQERVVLWSIYLEPKNTTARELHRAAGEIAGRLTKEVKKK